MKLKKICVGIIMCAAMMLHANIPKQKPCFVCLPHKQEPCSSYRIMTQEDVATQCAFSFDPRQLGSLEQEKCSRCWFKIGTLDRKNIYNLLKSYPNNTRIQDAIAQLEKQACTQDLERALSIIKEIVTLSSGNVQAWHFTTWLAYERPLAIK